MKDEHAITRAFEMLVGPHVTTDSLAINAEHAIPAGVLASVPEPTPARMLVELGKEPLFRRQPSKLPTVSIRVTQPKLL